MGTLEQSSAAFRWIVSFAKLLGKIRLMIDRSRRASAVA